ncbi:hypothetical protein CC86DRAFT_287013 [Ophiobolus disseminans]|uniref:N-acetyltransferase domain-containing protein n=1 Tax=Ophiobolus disseminans TaxID=1469910 RepID=A0A6A7A9Y6_9PLEO|nr:hypothetical protein CC86DRAFT_287013 [Ophiobolus disseminans]
MSRDPSSVEMVQSAIHNPPNALQEDPDVEEDITYQTIPASMVTEEQWNVCAATFSAHYGVWSARAQAELAQIVPEGANNILIIAVTKLGSQVGHCFVSQWRHRDDRVWWITQLVVQPEYRDQRRATRMLQALVKHYDIGRNSQHKDFVGVLSSNPYTICAVLRVFGRGIESLPSKPELEGQRGSSRKAHYPMHPSEHAPLMQTSPVDYVRNAKVHRTVLVADTNFFIDHTVRNWAVRTISYAMNKQLHGPWQWPFGDLPEGHEYLCLLEYRLDPEYAMKPRLFEQFPVKSTPANDQIKFISDPSKPGIDYAQINEFLIKDMAACNALDSSSVVERVGRSREQSHVKARSPSD